MTAKILTADQVVKTILKIKDEIKRINGDAANAVKELDASLLILEGFLAKMLMNAGVENMRAASGTFYREKVMTPSCGDWPAFYKWIARTDNFEALERRVTKKFVKEYVEANGELPDGISIMREYKIRVRRSNEG